MTRTPKRCTTPVMPVSAAQFRIQVWEINTRDYKEGLTERKKSGMDSQLNSLASPHRAVEEKKTPSTPTQQP